VILGEDGRNPAMTTQPRPTSQDPTDRLSEAAGFVERFTEVWADPSPERLNELVHPDAVLVQPIEPVARGHAAAAALWRRLFGLIPDLRGELLDWACRGETVFIELRLRGTLDGRPVEWVTVDRIHLEAGKVRERTANFDPLPLVRALALRPRALLRFLRARLLP
jgi:ketosteroid isomerase-like protein